MKEEVETDRNGQYEIFYMRRQRGADALLFTVGWPVTTKKVPEKKSETLRIQNEQGIFLQKFNQ